MNKVVCDKCGSDVRADDRERTPGVKIGLGALRVFGTWYEYDLCNSCYERILEWVRAHPAAEKA